MKIHSFPEAFTLWHYEKVTIGKGKRPRDPNQLAKWIVEQSTAETTVPEEVSASNSTVPTDISAYLSNIGRKGGQIGGKRRLQTMTKEQRRKVAVKAAKARWSSPNKPNPR